MSFVRTWIPNQHGAWAMLITPVAVGAWLGTPQPVHALLLLAWLAGYCANFFGSLAVKTGRWARYRPQLLVYGSIAGGGAALLSVQQPRVLLLTPVVLVALLANLYFVRTRNERAWVNDVVGILLAGAVGFGAFGLGYTGDDPLRIDAAWQTIAVVCGYFVGTVLYVKTIIRERGVRHWYWLSIGFHLGFALLLAFMQWWLLTGAALAALLRAIVVPGLGWTPKRVGLLEVVFTLAFGIGALLPG